MSFNNIAYPQFIFIQSTEPSDKTQGKLWYKTTENKLYTSNGTNYLDTTPTLGFLQELISENSLGILEIQATDTLTAGSSAHMISDIFSDTTGYLNTISSASSTAMFSTNKYGSGLTNITDWTATTGEGTLNLRYNTNYYAFTSSWVAPSNGSITQIKVKSAKVGSPTGNIWVAIKSALADAEIGRSDNVNVATLAGAGQTTYTFTTPVSVVAGQTYWIINTGDFALNTSNYVVSYYRNQADSDVQRATNSGFTSWTSETGAGKSLNLEITISSTSNGKVQTNMQTLSITPTKFQIFAYKKAYTGSGSITADISFDNGAHYQTGIALDTETLIVNAGNQMICKINCLQGSGTSTLQGYGVLFN
jgi:hypothetical protein